MKKLYFMALAALLAGPLFAQKNWIVLFDGSSTNALRGYKMDTFPEGVWTVKNGSLIAVPKTKNVDMVSKERFKDFELEYEWAVDTAANSGVFFHVQEKKAMESGNGNSPNWLENFEIQILDDKYFNDTAAIRSAGSLYDLIVPKNKTLKPIGQFNQARLIHKDGHVEHWLNGKKVLEFQIGSPEMKAILAKSKFKNNPNYHTDTEGHLMFQHHGQRAYYRNIRVRRL
ncbi:3-keto-disaccharide hydrolase [Runella sp.]|uniref:3-keto-disaccharide hydrolase n=1 Tax=Runella sp. TaxID=1960881 RepID=UPI003D10AE65